MMDKSDQTLVPQWLKSNGSVSGNGCLIIPLPSSSSRSDDYVTSKVVRKNSSSTYDQNNGRSSASERIKSSYFRGSSSNNGSANLRTSNSFGRNQRDRDGDDNIYKSFNKNRSILGDSRRRDYSDSLRNDSSSSVERNSLRRSHSMNSDQQGETWPSKVETGPKMVYKISNNDVSPLPENLIPPKGSFEQDFPSLGVQEKLADFEIRRVPSPSLSAAIHSFPVAASATIGSGKWTSALAEVPGIVQTKEAGVSCAKEAAPGLPTISSSISSGLSMAETVAQGPPHLQTTPQLSTESQRQELAIKQSRQLIPVTPSLPKALVSNPPERTKAKIGHPQMNHYYTHGGSVKPDLSKTSNIGKLQVLKPVREKNGAFPAKDNLSPTNNSKVFGSVPAATHSVSGSSSSRTQVNNSCRPAAERKHVLAVLEKRPISHSHTQSRNDFFSLMRKKSIPNLSPTIDSVSVSNEKTGESEREYGISPIQSGEVQVLGNLHVINSSANRNVKTSNGDSCNGCESRNSKKNGSSCNSLFSEEEEAAFLRSLGWEENTEEGGLTDEEISAFYKDFTKYIDSKPSWKILQGIPKFLLALESQIGNVAGISTRLSSSSSKQES